MRHLPRLLTSALLATLLSMPLGFSFLPGPKATVREMLQGWELLGDASVAERVLRLTPDAQSKTGVALSRQACTDCRLGFELYASFRLHGAGSSLVGDGIAVWCTRDRVALQAGGLFGVSPRYEGLAAFLSSYTGGGLPRLALVANDGTEFVAAPGLAASELFYIHGVTAGDYINRDVRDWDHCATISDMGFDGTAYARGFSFAASATTGDLSQAHDLVELFVVPAASEGQLDDPERLERSRGAVVGSSRGLSKEASTTHAASSQNAAGPSEAESTKVVDSLLYQVSSAMARLESVRSGFDTRIDAVHEHMEQLLERLKAADDLLDARLSALERLLHQQMQSLEESQQAAARSWVLPFVCLAVALILLGAWGCRQYCRIRKIHDL